jgi:hypothetical protein
VLQSEDSYISSNRPYRVFEWDPNPRKEVVPSCKKSSWAGTKFSVDENYYQSFCENDPDKPGFSVLPKPELS